MNAITGEWALKKLVLRYSETGGSSLGVRFYFRHLLEGWKDRNGQVEVVTEHSQFEHPCVRAEWMSGEKHETNMANLKPKQIENLLNFYRNSQGPNLYLRHGGPRCWTQRRTIQGLWQPSLEGSLKSLKWFYIDREKKNFNRALKYSPSALKLASDHYNGITSGRWGSPELHGTPVDVGFNKSKLNEIFSSPFNS